MHRGFDNVYVLTRGVIGFADAFPHYVEGDAAALPRPPPSSSPRKGSRGTRSVRAAASTASTARALSKSSNIRQSASRYNRGGSSRDYDDDCSRMSELSVAESVISRATTRKSRY